MSTIRTVENRAFIRALELSPKCSNAWHRYGVPHLTSLRRFGEAETALRRALEIDPFSPLINAHLGLVLTYRKQFSAAEKQFFKALEMDPDFAETHSFIGQMYWWSGQTKEAEDYLHKGLDLSVGNLRMRCSSRNLRGYWARGTSKKRVERFVASSGCALCLPCFVPHLFGIR